MFDKFSFKCWYWPVIICVPLIIVVWYWCYPILTPVTTVYLVRHAEKGTGANPSLTQPGVTRAQVLASLLRSAGLATTYSTEYCRTAQTAQAAAQSNNVSIDVFTYGSAQADFESCDPEIEVQTQVTDAQADHANKIKTHILANHQGGSVLVVGHSNTVPAIVKALGAPDLCPTFFPLDNNNECHIPGGQNPQYDNLFIVSVSGNGNANLVRLRYGNPTN